MKNPASKAEENHYAIFVIFFASGFPALLYQIIWQRSLFTIYGVNIESVTVVVAAFMLGLGLGSILGGRISKNPRMPVLAAFSVTELVIAIFGLNSLRFFEWVGTLTLGSPPWEIGLITFLMILLPTLMMGATLPLLVAYLVRRTGNVGRSTGVLYFFNTLGSAFACLLAATFLMGTYGKEGSVAIAAGINLAISAASLLLYLRQRNVPNHSSCDEIESAVGTPGTSAALSYKLAVVLAFLCGFIALSYEIIWIRLFSIGLASNAAVFPLVLSMYLAGIAWGAFEARRFCPGRESGESSVPLRALAAFIFVGNLAGFFLVPIAVRFFQNLNVAVALLLVIPAAACLGASFPLISHLAIPPDGAAGSRLSYLYLTNIVGATVGSLLTGYILLDHQSMSHINLSLAFLGFTMVGLLLIPARIGKINAITLCLLLGAALVFLVSNTNAFYDRVYERLLFKQAFTSSTHFAHVVENRSGVITVTTEGTVYGEGVFDGRFNLDVINDPNIIVRAYLLSAFHPSPREVLMIGLASGSWSQVVANNPKVEKLTIVEINPGYLELIPHYPAVASLLKNPKVSIVIDDGRRWLARANGRKFDAIVMNTTWHWRAFTTNLLSKEFLLLVKAHLKEGGILYYNTTDSPEAQKTGATVFADAYRFFNFMVVSDAPINVDKKRARNVLENYYIDGKPVLDLSNQTNIVKLNQIIGLLDNRSGQQYIWNGLESKKDVLIRTRGAQLITDNNMLTEWQTGFNSFHGTQ